MIPLPHQSTLDQLQTRKRCPMRGGLIDFSQGFSVVHGAGILAVFAIFLSAFCITSVSIEESANNKNESAISTVHEPAFSLTFIIVNAAEIACSLLVIVGAQWRKAIIILPATLYNAASFLVLVIGIIVVLLLSATNDVVKENINNHVETSKHLTLTFTFLAGGCAVIYYSAYTKLREDVIRRHLDQLQTQVNGLASQIHIFFSPNVTLDQILLRVEDNYEIHGNLQIAQVLGAGNFGRVHKGTVSNRRTPTREIAVAVKVSHDDFPEQGQRALKDELKMLIAIDVVSPRKHPNIITFVGIKSSTSQGQVTIHSIVAELCDLGDLRSYISQFSKKRDKEGTDEEAHQYVNEIERKWNKKVVKKWENKKEENKQNDAVEHEQVPISPSTPPPTSPKLALSTSDLLSYSVQIASGMQFLSTIPCIHRDLAARNCLLKSNGTVKIADFGLSRTLDKEYYRKGSDDAVPFRWLSPESLAPNPDAVYSIESDVWMFGNVLYELFSLGDVPYRKFGDYDDLVAHLKKGKRNKQPKYCSDDIYRLMLETWSFSPSKRPSFKECHQRLAANLMRASPVLYQKLTEELEKNKDQADRFAAYRGPLVRTAALDPDRAPLLP